MTSDRVEVLARGKYLEMVKRGPWEYVVRPGIPGAVVIVAVTPQRELLLVEQRRVPLDARVIELPAGLAGDISGEEHEALATAASRELLEETGYEAGAMIELASGPTTAGLSNEQVTLFLATNLRRVSDGGGDDAEDILVHCVPLAQVPQWLDQARAEGKLVDVKIFAGLYFLQAREG